MCYLLYQHQWNPNPFHFCCKRCHLLCNHGNGDLFTCDHMLFSCVKICFQVEAQLVLHWFLFHNWSFTGHLVPNNKKVDSWLAVLEKTSLCMQHKKEKSSFSCCVCTAGYVYWVVDVPLFTFYIGVLAKELQCPIRRKQKPSRIPDWQCEQRHLFVCNTKKKKRIEKKTLNSLFFFFFLYFFMFF